MTKQAYFEQRLLKGSAFLHLDARRPGVRLPRPFAEDSHVVLQYGYDLKIPIPDLAVSEWGVRATLSFSRAPFATAVPWSAVYAVHGDDGEGCVWHEDMPGDLQRDAGPPPAQAQTASSTPKKARHLKLVD